MKYVVPLLFCLLTSLPNASALNSRAVADVPAASVSAETREGRLQIFDDVWETIRERYYDPNLHGVDWQRLSAQFRPLAAAARDGRFSFAKILLR